MRGLGGALGEVLEGVLWYTGLLIEMVSRELIVDWNWFCRGLVRVLRPELGTELGSVFAKE
jgi:hypothetical protein